MALRYLSAEQLLADSQQLALQVLASNFQPDLLVALWRGGTPVGIAMQEVFVLLQHPCEHFAIRCSSYSDLTAGQSEAEGSTDSAEETRSLPKQQPVVKLWGLEQLQCCLKPDCRVLLVDDVFDSGRTLAAACAAIRLLAKGMPLQIRLATPWFKPGNNQTDLLPDYHLHTTADWLVFPHELLGLDDDQLLAKPGNKPLLEQLVELRRQQERQAAHPVDGIRYTASTKKHWCNPRMTYCVAISVAAGMVFCSDSRTNAGVDQISTYSKMFRFDLGPERQFVILTAGNLATTQATMAQLKKDIRQNAGHSLDTVTSIGEAADYLGDVSRQQQDKHSLSGVGFQASFILGGQIAGNEHRIVMIYPEGNHITSSKDTPYLQIGESKYGKPILDRILTLETPLDTAALCALVSMDSTMRSNLSVGPPIEVLIYQNASFNLHNHYRFGEDSGFLRDLKKSWDNRLKDAFHQLPPLRLEDEDLSPENESNIY